jgi:uncharacterized protein (TIGR04141 family)
MPKTKTFTLYLAKSDAKAFEDLLTQTARDRVNAGNVVIKDSTGLGNNARAFIFDNIPQQPKWLLDLSGVFTGLPPLKNKSSCAVVVFEHAKRTFVTSFAHGWQYVDEAKIEMDFGLKVVINSLSDDKVKRIDRSHLGEAIKGVSQSAFQRNLQAFGIDEALDLVRRITGRTDKDDFADSLSGATALKITREMTLSELAEVAEEALTRFQSEAYKKTGFQIIDKVQPILDQRS